MIKAIILDIDGVIIGTIAGYNLPHPHPDVMQTLKTIRSKGVPIICCTARPSYAIENIIQSATLNNPHITDAGAVIIDPIDNIVVGTHIIENILAEEIIQICLENRVYTEFYTIDNYFSQKSQESDITQKHSYMLRKSPKIVASLINASVDEEITKIILIAKDSEEKKRINGLLTKFVERVSISWGAYPATLPLQFGIVTALGSSKKEAAIAVASKLEISFDTILGIGDSLSDWQFIDLCGYGAVPDNADNELKRLIRTKGANKYLIGPSVDENGVFKIFQYFLEEVGTLHEG